MIHKSLGVINLLMMCNYVFKLNYMLHGMVDQEVEFYIEIKVNYQLGVGMYRVISDFTSG